MRTTSFQEFVNDDRFIKAFRRAMIVNHFGISGEFVADEADFLAHRERKKNYLVIQDVLLLRSKARHDELFLRVAHVTDPGTIGLPPLVGVVGTKLL